MSDSMHSELDRVAKAFDELQPLSARFILLTPDQAKAVSGETAPGHTLQPVELADGGFALPEAVLKDPAHEAWREFLGALPRAGAIKPLPAVE